MILFVIIIISKSKDFKNNKFELEKIFQLTEKHSERYSELEYLDETSGEEYIKQIELLKNSLAELKK